MRITVRDLRESVVAANEFAEQIGSDLRLSEQGRNGYQAVDIVSIHDKTGCIVRNLVCGTSRECREEVYNWRRSEGYRIERDKKSQAFDKLETTIRQIIANYNDNKDIGEQLDTLSDAFYQLK